MHIAPGPSDRDLERRWRENVAAFPRLIVPTASLATLARLDPERVIVAPNGTDTARIRPGPWPDRPVVGMVSGAAAGRGIEELVEAARRARAQVRELELVLWLVATDEASAAYLATLQADLARHPWIHMPGAVPFDQLGMHLARATVLCTPNPPDTYWDVAAPIKLFDGMAAGRPAVVTPRLEMSRVVASTGAGIVAASDDPDDVAAAIVRVLEDPGLARRYGEAGRRAAETTYDWRAISGALADRLLADPLFG
jgi:glycosyltransferase involved in cell wall biosynthesis